MFLRAVCVVLVAFPFALPSAVAQRDCARMDHSGAIVNECDFTISVLVERGINSSFPQPGGTVATIQRVDEVRQQITPNARWRPPGAWVRIVSVRRVQQPQSTPGPRASGSRSGGASQAGRPNVATPGERPTSGGVRSSPGPTPRPLQQ